MAAMQNDAFKRDAVGIALKGGLIQRQVGLILRSGFRRFATGQGRFPRKPLFLRRMQNFRPATISFAKRTASSAR